MIILMFAVSILLAASAAIPGDTGNGRVCSADQSEQTLGDDPAVLEITSANSFSVFRGTGGMFQVTATGTAPITYYLTGAAPGISIDSSGLITILGTMAANTYTFTVNASDGTAPNAAQPFTLTVIEPTYGISLTPSADKDFGSATVGYGAQGSHLVTVNNTGNQPTGALTVVLSGTDLNDFTLSTASISSIAVSGNDSFTVVPKTGLPVGTYDATVTITGGHGISASFNVSFEVKLPDTEKPTVVNVSPSGTGAALSGHVTITFSEPMYTSIPGTVTLNGTPLSSSGGSWSADSTIYTIPYNGLALSTAYTVNITGFKDASDNKNMMDPDSGNSFTTAATAPTMHTVTVNNGTGGGSYAAGGSVTITAGTAPAGKVFDKWTTSSGVTFADASSETTTFTMPAKAVTVTATYKSASGSEPSGSGGSKILGLDPMILAAIIIAVTAAAAAAVYFLRKR